jgi:hypothetical protein
MANLPNLKWIPMIAKAYQEARMRTESEMAHNSTVTSEPAVQALHPNLTRSSPRRRVDTKTQPRRSTRKSQGATTNSLKTSTNQKASELQYQSVVQELREAKRRLQRLESVHRELTVMQTRLESQMNELIHRLDKSQHSHQAKSVETDPHPSSPTA